MISSHETLYRRFQEYISEPSAADMFAHNIKKKNFMNIFFLFVGFQYSMSYILIIYLGVSEHTSARPNPGGDIKRPERKTR